MSAGHTGVTTRSIGVEEQMAFRYIVHQNGGDAGILKGAYSLFSPLGWEAIQARAYSRGEGNFLFNFVLQQDTLQGSGPVFL